MNVKYFKDVKGEIIGFTFESAEKIYLFDRHSRRRGTYLRWLNQTFDEANHLVGKGNLLESLIKKPQKNNPALNPVLNAISSVD